MSATQDRAAIAGVSRPRIGPWIQVAHHKRTSACFIHARLCDCPEGSGDTGHTGDCSYHGVWWHGDAGSTCDQAAIAAHFAAGTSPTALGPALASMSEWVTPRAAAMREAGHTYAGELACDAGEYVMARKDKRQRGKRVLSVRSVFAVAAAAGFWAARKAGAR